MKKHSVSEIAEEVETVPELRFAARAVGLDVERDGRRRFTLRWHDTGAICIEGAAWDDALAVLIAIYPTVFQRRGER